MSARELFGRYRDKLSALVALGLLVAGIANFDAIVRWFGGGRPAAPAAPGPEPSPPQEVEAKLPRYRFDGAALERLRAAFEAYEQIRALLAADRIDGDAQATALRGAILAALSGLNESSAPPPPALSTWIGSAADAAQALATAEDLPAARQRFAALSLHLVGLASVDPRLAQGFHVFECPMTQGFGKWFQRTPKLENPYMGQRMPACGSPAEWSVGEPASSAQTQAHAHERDEVAYYTCPMHPSVRKQAPGKCPICGMELAAVTEHEARSGVVIVDEVRRQRIGVRTERVERRKLALSIRAVGAVKFDESRLSDVNLRMSGWVQNLLVDESGRRVKRGQTLFTLYSPELYSAQLEYLSALRRRGGSSTSMFESLLSASKNRLRLLGLTDAQIRELEARGEASQQVPIASPASGYVVEKNVVSGARVEAGTRVYRIADLSQVWIDADVYESDLPHVRVGQKVTIALPHVPGRSYDGRVDYIYPTLAAKTRTGRVRVVLDNPKLELKPEMYADVRFEVDLGEQLAIPDSAVIYTGPRRLVFVDLGEGRLRPQEVELGARAGGYYAVEAGLREGDVVVTSGNFLIAAESRIRSAAEHWETHHGSE